MVALSLEKGIQEYSGKKENIPGKVHLTKKIFAPEAFLTVNTARGKYFFIICIFSLISILDRSTVCRCSLKWVLLKISKISHEETLVLEACGPATLLKRDSGTGLRPAT